jgi:hypothetical protein
MPRAPDATRDSRGSVTPKVEPRASDVDLGMFFKSKQRAIATICSCDRFVSE